MKNTHTVLVKFRASALNSMSSNNALFRIKGFLSNLELNNPDMIQTLMIPPSFVNKENAFMRSGIEFERQTLDELEIEHKYRGRPFFKEFTHPLLNGATGIISGTVDAIVDPMVLLNTSETKKILMETSPENILLKQLIGQERKCILEIKRVHSEERFNNAKNDYLVQCAVYEHLFEMPLFMLIAYEDAVHGMQYRIVSPHRGQLADSITTENFLEKVNSVNIAVRDYLMQEKMLKHGVLEDEYFLSIKEEMNNFMMYKPSVENAKNFAKLMLLNHKFKEDSITHSGMVFSKSDPEDSRYLTAEGKRYLLESDDVDAYYPLKKRHPTYKFKVNGQNLPESED